MTFIDTRLAPPVAGRRSGKAIRIGLFIAWLALASYLAAAHVMWRDEVRALSFALSGDNVPAMLGNIHGEGHPALWYLILRGAHALMPVPQAMAVAAFAIGAAAALLFAMRAPFGWPIIALALFGRFALYEYTVMARNYGISMLILFAFAALYTRHRNHGLLPGILLFLLCNTNVHSALLAAGLLLFWLIDLWSDEPIGWTPAWRGFLLGAALAALGALACVMEVYPPFNDAATAQKPNGPPAIGPFKLGSRFRDLVPREFDDLLRKIVVPLVLIGCLVRLATRPAAFAAGIVGLLGLSALFAFVYPGAYRHQALLIPFLITLCWLMAEGNGGRWPGWLKARMAVAWRLRWFGAAALPALLALQDAQSVAFVTRAIHGMPESRSYDLARLLQRPDLRDAIVMTDPDYKAEALPYYAPNPLYFVREQRFGRWAIFSKRAQRTVSLGFILDTATRLVRETGRPVVFASSEPLFRSGRPGYQVRENFGDSVQTAEDLRRLRAIARPIADFDHVTAGDESYAVYVIDRSSIAADQRGVPSQSRATISARRG